MPRLIDTHLTNRERIQPNQANNNNTAHGGIVMKHMDEVGAMSAMRFTGKTCVTVQVDNLDFRRPIPLGQTALIEAFVYETGETSVWVHIHVSREDPRTGETETTTEARFKFVALDDNGEPTTVPSLTVETERGTELRSEARANANR